MITVAFFEITHHFFGSETFNRIQSGEIEPELLPRVNDYVVIGSSQFEVKQVTFYPFGDSEGNKGARVYVRKL